jgi:diadenosine tetraphosphate (Ap4A) HIT family hydrolase
MTCCFCDEFRDPANCEYYHLVGKSIGISNRIIYETDNFAVVPTIGGVVRGYLLIVSKRHELSLANISKELYREYSHVMSLVSEKTRAIYNCETVIFEHGITESDAVGVNTVNHLHIHIFPFPHSFWDYVIREHTLNSIQVFSSYSKAYDHLSSSKPLTYLFLRDTDGIVRIIKNHPDLPSQLFRAVLAKSVGHVEWNWRNDYCVKNLEDTYRKFTS